MQPPSSSSLRPPPSSSSFSFRPPLHGSVGRPPVGSISTMDASRFTGSQRASPGSFGSADHANLDDDGVQQRGEHSIDMQQQLEQPQGFGNSSGSPHVQDFPFLQDLAVNNGATGQFMEGASDAPAGHHYSRINDKEGGFDSSTLEISPPTQKETAINAITLEKLAGQIADLQHLVKNQQHSNATRRSRSQRRRMVRSPSRVRTTAPNQPPPTMDRAWNKVVQHDGLNNAQPMTLKFFPPAVSTDGVSVCPPLEVAREGMDRWQRTLVGYFIEGRPSFLTVKEQVTKLWGPKGLIDVMANDRGFFFFKFTSSESCSSVLEAGPWIVQRQPLFLQPWKPGMRLFRESHDTIPLWVKLFNVPLEYWSETGFGYLGSAVGVPLFPDSMTASGRCVNFMRLCVEVTASKPLVENFDLILPPNVDGSPNIAKIRVEYPWKPKLCGHCHVFGHTENNCFKLKREKQALGGSSIDGAEGLKANDPPTPLTQSHPEENVVGLDGGTTSSHMETTTPELSSNPNDKALQQDDRQQIVQTSNEATGDVIMVRQSPPITTSPNKFSLLEEEEKEDGALMEVSMGSLASKIQHIDGGFASARKKKNKGKMTGGTSATIGPVAQPRKTVRLIVLPLGILGVKCP